MDIRGASQTEKKAYALLPRLWETGKKAALAVILEARGSTPQVPGAAALVSADGLETGTVGGGGFEAAIVARCQHLLESGESQVLKWTFSAAVEEGSLCGGEALVLLNPVAEKDRSVFARVTAWVENRLRGVLLTTVKLSHAQPALVGRYCIELETQHSGERARAAGPDESGNIPLAIPFSTRLLSQVLEEETPLLETRKGEQGEVWHLFYEPIIPPPRLLVFGAGHVGQALARLGVFSGYEVTLFDDRKDIMVPDDLLAKVRFVLGDLVKNLSDFLTDEMDFAVIVTRGHRHDAAVLRVALQKKLTYIGMIGSRRKVALMREEFISRGWASEAKWAEVHAPIGLRIGAKTVEEIAVSIMAEIIKVRRAKNKL